jgi:hypothetical protein
MPKTALSRQALGWSLAHPQQPIPPASLSAYMSFQRTTAVRDVSPPLALLPLTGSFALQQRCMREVTMCEFSVFTSLPPLRRRVFALPRSRRAINRRQNVVDPGRLSPSYESRLAKYARRGFKVAVPWFPGRGSVNSSIYLKPYEKLQVRILVLAYLRTSTHVSPATPPSPTPPPSLSCRTPTRSGRCPTAHSSVFLIIA